MLTRILKFSVIFSLFWSFMTHAIVETPSLTWFQRDSQNNPQIFLHFFWSKKCPHCLDALPYLKELDEDNDWLTVKDYQLVGNPEYVEKYQLLAKTLGQEARSVPAFLFCNTMMTGFTPQTTPDLLKAKLKGCHKYLQTHDDLEDYVEAFISTSQDTIDIELPLLGKLTPTSDSLLFITLAIAGVDAFNPCAFFVLMFLLSMMMHTGSRKRMLLVGGVFVFFSALLYFLFMAAWLNLFRVTGQLEFITVIAAVVAIGVGAINTKEFFRFKKGISLTIPDSAKPGLYQRVRNLMQASSLYTLILATIGLSFFANLYEFLCTAGFPMVYTRILTLNELTDTQYYLYLALYNIIYVLPLFIIVMVISFTLGSKKLQQQEGRRLKLISGMMMLTLGGVLLVEPNLLNNLTVTISLMLLAIGSAVIMIVIDKQQNHT